MARKYRPILRDLIKPMVGMLCNAWTQLQHVLLRVKPDIDRDQLQRVIDDTYEVTLECLRRSIEGVASWQPESARRPFNQSTHMPMDDLNRMPMGAFMQRLKRKLDGSSTATPDETVDPSVAEFRQFYSTIFSDDSPVPIPDSIDSAQSTPMPADLDTLSFDAVQSKLKKRKSFRAMGMDNIPIELFKLERQRSSALLSCMFQTFYRCRAIPSIWKESRIALILKPGLSRSDCSSYRCVSVLSHLRNLYESCVRELLLDTGVMKTHPLQFGFQRGFGCPEAIYTANSLIDFYKSTHRPLNFALLDIWKAYDRVQRGIIWRKLMQRSIPMHILVNLHVLFDNCKVTFQIDGVSSDPLRLEVGLLQGSVLSPCLFNILVDDLPDRLTTAAGLAGPRLAGRPIPCILFADDQTIFFTDAVMGQRLLTICSEHATENRYQFNVAKSRVQWKDTSSPSNLILSGEAVPNDVSGKILGVLYRQGKVAIKEHVQALSHKAAQSMRRLTALDVLGSRELAPAKKRVVVSAWIRSVFEYGMAFLDIGPEEVEKCDKVLRMAVARCFRVSRGTVPMRRFMGIVPTRERQQYLRLVFQDKLKKGAEAPVRKLHAVVYRAMSNVRKSLTAKWEACPIWKEWTRAYDQDCAAHDRTLQKRQARAAKGRLVGPPPPPPTRKQSLYRVFQSHCWSRYDKTSKNCRIQVQLWDRPHVAGYHCMPQDILVHKWIVGLAPAMIPQRCLNCEGRYLTSKMHCCICINVMSILYPIYDHSTHMDLCVNFDNVIDYLCSIQLTRNVEHIRAQLDTISAAIRKIQDHCVVPQCSLAVDPG